jgi:hypothetical protein
MTDINIDFCRTLLAQIKPDLKRAKRKMFKDAWVYHFRRDHWEFHGPDNFYWNGSAGNAYEARYKGWMAWLEQQGLVS